MKLNMYEVLCLTSLKGDGLRWREHCGTFPKRNKAQLWDSDEVLTWLIQQKQAEMSKAALLRHKRRKQLWTTQKRRVAA